MTRAPIRVRGGRARSAGSTWLRLPDGRPKRVTIACVTSIALGALFLPVSVVAVVGGHAALGEGAPLASALAGLGYVLIGMALLGIVAGVGGFFGAGWARWTMVALFALGGLLMVFSMGGGGLALLAVNATALYCLLNGRSSDWFDAQAPRSAPAQA